MMKQLKNLFARLCKPGEKGIRLLMVLGLVGIVLVGLSEWLPSDKEAAVAAGASTGVSAAELEAALEERILLLLTDVRGVGVCRVMVTLEQGVQQVYATQSSQSSAGNSQQTLTVATGQGLVGLPIAEIQPVVKGVAVACAGGDDPAVCQRVTDLIATVFNISSRRVCVVETT